MPASWKNYTNESSYREQIASVVSACMCTRCFQTFWWKQWYKYRNCFLVVISPAHTRERGAAGNSNECVCLLPLAGAQHRRRVISKRTRGLKNWKPGDKLLFSWGAKQQHDFSESFCLCPSFISSLLHTIALNYVHLFMQIVFSMFLFLQKSFIFSRRCTSSLF